MEIHNGSNLLNAIKTGKWCMPWRHGFLANWILRILERNTLSSWIQVTGLLFKTHWVFPKILLFQPGLWVKSLRTNLVVVVLLIWAKLVMIFHGWIESLEKLSVVRFEGYSAKKKIFNFLIKIEGNLLLIACFQLCMGWILNEIFWSHCMKKGGCCCGKR